MNHDEVIPIADGEKLYRRISVSACPPFYDPVTDVVSDQAFAPHKTADVTGLSVSRARFKSLEDAAKGRPGKVYYVAVLEAGQLRSRGIQVVPRPELPDGMCDISHAELPDLRADVRKDDITLERQRMLAKELCLRVEGPFESSDNQFKI